MLQEKNADLPEEIVRLVEKNILLQVLDQLWKEHIASLDYMRYTIVLRAYGQKDPLNEYKKEAFNMFSDMLDMLRERVTFITYRVQIQPQNADDLQLRSAPTRMQEVHETPQNLLGGNRQEPQADKTMPFKYVKTEIDPKDPNTWGKVSRNEPCPCGSGLKYKHCHGKIAV
jgi:preprotein translocase subunit SecA